MIFQGKLWKDIGSSYWLVEVSFLKVMTQGDTRKEALEMLKDVILELLKDAYENLFHEKFELTVILHEADIITVESTDDTLLFALGQKRQRLFSR